MKKLNKNAFTLVELLGVIMVLAAIALITLVSVSTTLKNSKESLSDTQKKLIESASKSYYIKEGMNDEDLTSDSTETCVNLSTLIEKGYLDGTQVIDPNTDEPLNGSVKIKYESNQYSYKYEENTCE